LLLLRELRFHEAGNFALTYYRFSCAKASGNGGFFVFPQGGKMYYLKMERPD